VLHAFKQNDITLEHSALVLWWSELQERMNASGLMMPIKGIGKHHESKQKNDEEALQVWACFFFSTEIMRRNQISRWWVAA